jgi:hypothetical protein
MHAMPSRQDPTSKRLLRLFQEDKLVRSLTRPIKVGIGAETLSELDDPIVHGTLSSTALTLDEADPSNAPLLRAFRAAGLDHRNPLNWRTLLGCFAKAHFGAKKTKPIKWDSAKFSALLKDYSDVKQTRPELSDLQVCNLLKRDKTYRAKYGDYNLHALRKLVRQARDPKFNAHLRYPEIRDPLLREIRAECDRQNRPWDEVLGKKIYDVLKPVIEVDSTGRVAWRRKGTPKGQLPK